MKTKLTYSYLITGILTDAKEHGIGEKTHATHNSLLLIPRFSRE